MIRVVRPNSGDDQMQDEWHKLPLATLLIADCTCFSDSASSALGESTCDRNREIRGDSDYLVAKMKDHKRESIERNAVWRDLPSSRIKIEGFLRRARALEKDESLF